MNISPKAESIVLSRTENMYLQKETVVKGRDYLLALIDVFNEGHDWTRCVKNALLDVNSLSKLAPA